MTERYQRHGLIDWFDQARLKGARIVVIGAGAVGNEVLKNLTLLGVGHLSIFDFDTIEEHNLTRCVLFRDGDIGRPKAEVAAAACAAIDPSISCAAHCVDFWDGLPLHQIASCDAVVCCVDNHEARVFLSRLCMLAGADLYNVGIDSRFVSAEVFPFGDGIDCACFECALPASAYEAMQKRFSCGWLKRVAIEERKVPTTAITSSAAGAAVVSLLLNRLSGHPGAPAGAVRWFHDTISLSSTLSVLPRSADCHGCSGFGRRPKLFRARRHVALGTMPVVDDQHSLDVVLSEPVALRGACTSCRNEVEFFRSTRKMTEAATRCDACGVDSVAISFSHRMPLREFEAEFRGRAVPCKYISYAAEETHVVVELED